jgi:hypothetical protein
VFAAESKSQKDDRCVGDANIQYRKRRIQMTLEYLNEQKLKYQQKSDYFKNIGFDILATDFQGVVDLIAEMENYIREEEDDKPN